MHNQWSQKSASTKFHLSRVTFEFGVLDKIRLFEFQVKIGNKRPRKPPSTEFHWNQVIFCNLVAVLASAIFNFEFWHQLCKQGSRKPQSTKFHWIKPFVVFWFAISNFQLVVISDFVVSNGVNGLNCSNCPNCSNCSNYLTVRTVRTIWLFEPFELFDCSNYLTVRTVRTIWLFEPFELFDCSNLLRSSSNRFEFWYFEPDTNSSKYLGSVHIPSGRTLLLQNKSRVSRDTNRWVWKSRWMVSSVVNVARVEHGYMGNHAPLRWSSIYSAVVDIRMNATGN